MILKFIPKKVIMYIVASAVLMGVGAFGGYTFCKRAQYKGVIKQQEKDAQAVLKHEDKKDVVDKKVNKQIEKIRSLPDTSSCLDVRNSDDYLNELQRADSIAESEFN